MIIQEQLLLEMTGVYAVNALVREGRQKLLAATEAQGDCWEIDLETKEKEKIWNGPGGTMGFADTHSEDGSFLAIQGFFPVFDSKHAVVARIRRDSHGEWWQHNVVNLPYVHRMDAVVSDSGKYFIGCTLCGSKQYTEDWSAPGAVWVGQFNEDGTSVQDLHPIIQGLTKNHGYWHEPSIDPGHAYVTCEEGIYQLAIPSAASPEWKWKKLSDEPTGDIALCDIDNDGELEMLVVQPFHGNAVSVQKTVDGKLKTVWKYEGQSQMGHVAWSGTIQGKPAFLFGFRRGRAELVHLTWENGVYVAKELDHGKGPANICVLHDETRDYIWTANLETGLAVLYTLQETGRKNDAEDHE